MVNVIVSEVNRPKLEEQGINPGGEVPSSSSREVMVGTDVRMGGEPLWFCSP
jgi:hypothetical protein